MDFTWRNPNPDIVQRWTWNPSRTTDTPSERARIWQRNFPSLLPPVQDQANQPICAPISLIQSMQAQYNVGGFRYLHHPVPILSLEHAIRVFWSLPDEQKNLERMLEWAAQKGVMAVQDYQRLYGLSVDNLEHNPVKRYRLTSYEFLSPSHSDFQQLVSLQLWDAPLIASFVVGDNYDKTGHRQLRYRGGGKVEHFRGKEIGHSVMVTGEGMDHEVFYEYQNSYGSDTGDDGFFEVIPQALHSVYVITTQWH